MRTKLTSLLACLLAGLLLSAPLTACHGGEENGDTGSESTSVSTPADESGSESESMTDPETEPDFTSLTIAGVDVQNYAVVVPADLPTGLVTVVDAFIQWVNESTGHTLPKITADQTAEHEIVIGQNVRENAKVAAAVGEIKNDGYAIVVDDGDLYLTASTARGVAYGVYDFLENYMGVRFYAQDFTVHHDVGAVALDEGMKEVFSPAYSARHRSLAAPAISVEYQLYAKWNSDLAGKNVGENTVIHAGSEHTLPPLAETGGAAFGFNPCLNDEAIFNTVLKNVLAKLDANPDQNVVQVGQGDGSLFCTCDKCTAFEAAHGDTHMAPMLDFCNRLAAEVNKIYPNVKIMTFCYEYSQGVPTDMEVSDNVVINYCLDKACFQHALTDPACPKNTTVAADLRKWNELCKVDNLAIYDYVTNCGYAVPGPNFNIMWDNAQFYTELDVGYMRNWGSYGSHELMELRYYLVSKLTWNPYMTEEEYYDLYNGFIDDFYGDAAPYIRAHIDSLYADENLLGCSAMFAPMEAFVPLTDADGKKDLTELRKQYAYFTDALKLDTLTDDERARIERASMIWLDALRDLIGGGKERREIEAVWDNYVAKYGPPYGVNT